MGNVVLKEFGFVPPVHYIVHDAGGGCAVLEYVETQLKVHKNHLGVLTNSPTFDWHVTNLRNYINLGVTGLPPLKLEGKAFAPFGQGSGMLGLPGDFTPPSRFIRAVAFTQSALPVDKAEDGVKQAFHILNQFDIPKGDGPREERRSRGVGLHAVDQRRRPHEPAVLLPHLRQQPHPDRGSHQVRPRGRRGTLISMGEKEEFEDVTGKAKWGCQRQVGAWLPTRCGGRSQRGDGPESG